MDHRGFGVVYGHDGQKPTEATLQQAIHGWIRECQQAYNERKFEAREEIAQRAKSRAAADAAERAYNASKHLGWGDGMERQEKGRTMAEFLAGKNKLTFAEREEMAQRDKNRPKTTDDGGAGSGE